MNTVSLLRILTLAASALLLVPAFGATKADLEQALSQGGLKKINVKGVDLAYARPGATLAKYQRIQLDAVDVAFSKDWDPAMARSRIKVKAEDRENIRKDVAKIVSDEFVKAMQKGGVYQVVNQAGPDVLRVKVNIVNLYITAPDSGSAGVSRTYTVSSGEVSLALELFDSASGEVLARVVDRREARRTPNMSLSTNASNTEQARSAASDWARILRDSLDKAHNIGTK